MNNAWYLIQFLKIQQCHYVAHFLYRYHIYDEYVMTTSVTNYLL